MILQEMFSSVLNMSLTGSLVILFVILARLLLRKAPKVFSYALWAVVLFRLLCPVSFSSVWSLLNLTGVSVSQSHGPVTVVEHSQVLDIYQYIPAEDPVENRPHPGQINTSIPENRTEGMPTPDAVSQQAPAEPVRDPICYAVTIWLVGIGVMTVISLYSCRKLGKKIIGAVRLRDNIYLADHIPTPFVLGVIRPRIYIPSALERSERRYIIAHERHHIRRKDHVIKLLAFAALCIHWFNPLVWIAFHLSGKDMEMSCDEAVIRRLGPKIRADYSASLLRLATGHRFIAGTPLAFGEGDTKGRVLNMAKWKKPSIYVLITAAVVCIGVLAACAMNPAQPNQQAAVDETNPAVANLSSQEGEEHVLWLTEKAPLEICAEAVEKLKNLESYYIHYEYSSESYEDAGSMNYRRHGNDLLIDSEDDSFFVGAIYYGGVYGRNLGDYWTWEREDSAYDPNEWLSRWTPEDKQITAETGAGVISGDQTVLIKFNAVWPHQLYTDSEYQGSFTYSFNADGSLRYIEREYVLMQEGERISATTDRITIMEEDPADTLDAIKAVADMCVTTEELEQLRSSGSTVTEVPSNKTDFDKDYHLGSGQMGWKFLKGRWSFKLGAENATPTGAILTHGSFSQGAVSLVAEENFWLEVLVDGKWQYVDNALTQVNARKETIETGIAYDEYDRYELNWFDSYGELKPGFYRVGRNYTVTMNSDETDTVVCYAKFRILPENSDTLLQQCRNAFDALLTSGSYHISVTDWLTQHDFTYYMTTEVWKNGADYLEDTKYISRTDPKVLENRRGSMLRDGLAYGLEWSGDTVTSPVSYWESNTYMDESTFTIWTFGLDWYDGLVEEVVQKGNTLSIIETYDFDDQYTHTELKFNFDAKGNLTGMSRAYLPSRNCAEKDKVVDLEMVVKSRNATEIGKIFASQDVSIPMSFSYQADKTANPDAVTAGFVNTKTQKLGSMDAVITAAAKECTLQPRDPLGGERYNIVVIAYDEKNEIWRVEFRYSQDDHYQAVYLNEQGITQMIVTK